MATVPLLPNDPERERFIEGQAFPSGPEAEPSPEDLQSLIGAELLENPDGSVTVQEPEPEVNQDAMEFGANLADKLDQQELNLIVTELFDLVELDKQARQKRDQQYAKGIKLMALDPEEKDGGSDMDGASRVGHPILTEASIDFAASAIKELYPVAGPVKMHIPGVVTKEKEAKARRKRDFLNWQLNNKTNYRAHMEVMLGQLPPSGAGYIKGYKDEAGRLKLEFVREDKVLLPFAADEFYTSPRITHELTLDKYELQSRVDSGLYIGDLPASAMQPVQSETEQALAKVEGKQESGFNEDGLRTLYEVNVSYALSSDPLTMGKQAPYLITIDETTRKCVAVYRNWEPEDQSLDRIHWLVQFPFIPWPGQPIGLYHVIGGLTVAARGALRALLDSAHVNNFPGSLALASQQTQGQSIEVNGGQITTIKAPANVDDVRKLAMPMPYNPPSETLFKLLGWLTETGKGVVTTAEEKIQDASNNMPVGTTLALIEQGAKVFSAIHTRLHFAQARVLKLVCMLNKQGIDPQDVQAAGVELDPADFQNNDDIVPVSDPNIFTEAQRYAQLQAVQSLSQDQRVQYDAYEIHRRSLEILKVPDIDTILPPRKKPQPINPAAENVQMSMGAPAMAFPDQDHAAHLEAHLRYFEDPYIGGSSYFVQQLVPLMVEHVKQHLAMLYGAEMNRLLSEALGRPASEVLADPRLSGKADALVAQASQLVHANLRIKLKTVQESLDRLLQTAQALVKPMPEDPAVTAARVAEQDVQRRVQKDQDDKALAEQKLLADERNKEADRTSKEVIEAAKLRQDAVQFLLDLASAPEPNLSGAGQPPRQVH